jgi:hypothetical protein
MEKFEGVYTNRRSHIEKLDDIEATFSPLILRHIGLWSRKFAGKFDLS